MFIATIPTSQPCHPAIEAHKQSQRIISGSHSGQFPPLKAGPYSLSIQGSSSHYCQPRESFGTLERYTQVEFCAYTQDGRDIDLNALLGHEDDAPGALQLERVGEHIIACYAPWSDVERVYLALLGQEIA